MIRFQSRNRESYLFKPERRCLFARPDACFNLVIENLIFSSLPKCRTKVFIRWKFQSRNRESYLFKYRKRTVYKRYCGFQSRNRESYLFKRLPLWCAYSRYNSFNLVIENLIFSRYSSPSVMILLSSCFNLVIENLIFSRIMSAPQIQKVNISFNLVIENLIFSRV